jgi:S1-C subfamily serine protease
MIQSIPTPRFAVTQRGSVVSHTRALVIAIFLLSASARAQSVATTRPLLDELNRETQTLFRQVAPSIVRVQLPFPTTFYFSQSDPLSKWANQLDAEQLARLAEQRRSNGASLASVEIRPTTSPSSGEQPATQPTQRVILMHVDHFNPNGIGIVFDDNNHLLVPRYVDKAACPGPIAVCIGDGRWSTASFVASDEKADLTLLKLNSHTKGIPATLAAENPAAGTLLLVMSLNPAANRLAVWQGWEPDASALVNTDGSIAGFTKAGHYLSAAACTPVVADLIEYGEVRRPFLGVVIDALPPDDPEREHLPALGATPALKIEQVIPGSAAERAGLAQNDLITSIAGESVGDAANFAAIIAGRRGITALGILRNGQMHVIQVDLEVR